MRIMHVTQCLGGVETYLRSFHAHGAFDGFECRVLVVPSECLLAEEWRAAGGVVEVVEMRREVGVFSDIKSLGRILRLMRLHRPDVVHLHSSKAGALGRIAALACRLSGHRAAVVYTPHAYYYLSQSGWRRRVFQWIERLLSCSTDLLMATSASEWERSLVDVGYCTRKICTISNGVSLYEPRARRPDNGGVIDVIFVGRICHQKNIELLARVIARFSAGEGVRFRIVGAGHYRQDRCLLDALLHDAGVDQGLVEIVPWLTHAEVQALFAVSDISVVTSRYESFGYVAAEAGAAGLPVVAANVDGLKDVVEAGVSGFLVEPEDCEGFVARIRQLSGDAGLRTRMGDAGRCRVALHFNVGRNAVAMRDVYAELR
jgi:glycosyltransferase involved in cell wall biosynthesis